MCLEDYVLLLFKSYFFPKGIEEGCSPEHGFSDDQQTRDNYAAETGDKLEVNTCETEKQEQSEDFELEGLSNQNKMHRPYRDTKSHVTEVCSDDDVRSQTSCTTTSTFDSREIRARVKKSLEKKQRAMRRRKRGEASAVTRSRRENREVVKQGEDSWNDFWWMKRTALKLKEKRDKCELG